MLPPEYELIEKSSFDATWTYWEGYGGKLQSSANPIVPCEKSKLRSITNATKQNPMITTAVRKILALLLDAQPTNRDNTVLNLALPFAW
jgi:hypothetical protein